MGDQQAGARREHQSRIWAVPLVSGRARVVDREGAAEPDAVAMTTYLLRRLLYGALTFLGITIATFALIHSVPGDPITFFIGRAGAHSVPPEILEQVRKEFH